MLEEKRKEFRIRLGDELPPELDTDFNLNRWIVNYDEVNYFVVSLTFN